MNLKHIYKACNDYNLHKNIILMILILNKVRRVNDNY